MPYSVSGVPTNFGAPSPCHSPSNSPQTPRGPAPAAPKPNGGNSKPEPKKPKKPGNQKSALSPSKSGPEREHLHFTYIGKDEDSVIGDPYKECELYAAFMANERMANDFADRGGKKRKRKQKKKREVHPFRSYFREQNSLHGINNTVRSARRRMFDLGLTHDQVAAAKERAGTSVWNYFESLRTHNGLFPGAKFIVCVFIALSSLGALTGIAYSLGIEHVVVIILAFIIAAPVSICVAAALPVVAKVGKLAAAIAIALVVDAAGYVVTKSTKLNYKWLAEFVAILACIVSVTPDAYHELANIWASAPPAPWADSLPTLIWPELPHLSGTRERFRVACCTVIFGYVGRSPMSCYSSRCSRTRCRCRTLSSSK